MREFIDIIQNISEATGLANRRNGDVFKGLASEDEIVFQDLLFFPEAGGQFQSPEEMDNAIDSVASEFGITADKITWINVRDSRSLGFGLAVFQSPLGPLFFGRYFRDIKPAKTSNYWANDGIPGYRFQGKAKLKEVSGYKPAQVFAGANSIDLTPTAIANQIIFHFGEGSDEAIAVDIFMKSQFPITIPRGNMDPLAFRDYFCEMLQPMALVMGKNIDGNADTAAEAFFDKPTFEHSLISFEANQSGGLYDSLISNQGQVIKLSTKGGAGAQASVINLLNSIAEISKTPKGAKLLDNYSSTISIMEIINDSSAEVGPLKLAMLPSVDLVDPADVTAIVEGFKVLDKLPVGTDRLPQGILPKRFMEMYEKGDPYPRDWSGVIPKQRMIAVLAYEVARRINGNSEFSEAAADILNHGAVIQMYTTVKATPTDITIVGFNGIYPSTAVSSVDISAAKTYGNNYKPKGKFTFRLNK